MKNENPNIAHHMSSLFSSGSGSFSNRPRLWRSIRQDMEIEKIAIKLFIRGRPIFKTKENWCKRKISRKERNAAVFLFTPTYPIMITTTWLLNYQELQVLWNGETAVSWVRVILIRIRFPQEHTCGKIVAMNIKYKETKNPNRQHLDRTHK